MISNSSWLWNILWSKIASNSEYQLRAGCTYSHVHFLCQISFTGDISWSLPSLLFILWVAGCFSYRLKLSVSDAFLWAFSIQQVLPKLWSIQRGETHQIPNPQIKQHSHIDDSGAVPPPQLSRWKLSRCWSLIHQVKLQQWFFDRKNASIPLAKHELCLHCDHWKHVQCFISLGEIFLYNAGEKNSPFFFFFYLLTYTCSVVGSIH